MDIKDVFMGKARKYNHYEEGSLPIDHDFNKEHSCGTCIRKHFSFPYTCNDGWPMGESTWRDRGSKCINWTDNSKCEVD
jgi:hypothetical protein